MNSPTVSVIGAGIAGLVFAQCLRQQGIRTILYETASAVPRHNYAITLHASAYRPLLKAVGANELDFRARVAVDAEVGGSGRIDSHVQGKAPHKVDSFRANRRRLETWLSESLEINFGARVEEVQTEPSTGKPQLSFASGRPRTTDVVVVADGVHSAVRKAQFQRSSLDVLPFVTFNGKRRVSRATFETAFAPAMKNENVLQERHGDTHLSISLNDIREGYASISWTYSRPSRGPDDVLHRPARSNAEASNIPEQLFEEIAALAGLEKTFAEVFDAEKLRQDRILHWLMRKTLLPLPELQALLEEKRTVLIGDAAHAHPIIGGNGANSAILDGVAFARALAQDGIDGMAKAYDTRYGFWKSAHSKFESDIMQLHDPQAKVQEHGPSETEF